MPDMTHRAASHAQTMGSHPQPKAASHPMGAGRRPLVAAGTLVSSEPWDTEDAWRPWHLCVTVEKPGSYGYRRRYLKTPGLALYSERFDTPCRLRGLATPDRLVLAVPLRLGPRSRYWGMPVAPDRLPVMCSGGVHWVVDAGQRHMMLLVAPSLIRRYVDADLQVALANAANVHALPVQPHAVEPLAAWLLGLIDEAAHGPEQWRRSAIHSLHQELLRQLVAAIDVPRLHRVKPDTSSRRAGLDRALEHLRVASLPGVNIPQLAEDVGVSARTQEYGFRAMFDLTPRGFLYLLRLHAVRRELIAPDADRRTVREIAEQWGFHQHGRFSGYYRRTFGELPSETRERRGRPLGSEGPSGPGHRQEL